MRALPLALVSLALLTGVATAQLLNGTGNGTTNTTVPTNGTPGTATSNGTGDNASGPDEPVAPPSPFPIGLALLVVGAAVIVGLLVYAASKP